MDKKINIYWLSYHEPDVLARGYWDQGLLEDLFATGNYSHTIGIPGTVKGGGIVIINGRTHINDTEKINADIAKLDWVLFIETGDEEASFPWREIKHPLMKVWIMLPRMNQHDDVSFHLPNGYRPNTRELLKDIGSQQRALDFFFAGQVNHDRREQCVEAARGLEDSYIGTIVETDGFGKEVMPYRDYLLTMASAKIVLCPSGIENPDNFRLYEALEAGCIPVVDAFSSKDKHPGFWRYLFGDDIPFPIIDYWDALPKLLPELLKEYPANANRIFAWWQLKKREIKYRLLDDVTELSR